MADGFDIGGVFGSPWMQGGMTGLNAIADLWSFFENQKRQKAMRDIYDITANPQKFAGYVQGFMPQLSDAARQSIDRNLSATWAARTGGAPGGAQAKFAANAWAARELDAQQTALSAALRALGIGGDTAFRLPQQAGGGTANILKSLQALRGLIGRPAGQPTQPGGLAPSFTSAPWVGTDVPIDLGSFATPVQSYQPAPVPSWT